MRWSDRFGRRLKLRELRILLAVAKSGSMGKAAVELAMSQPAVSKAIGDLEHTLNVRLFDRSPQGIEPNVYGRALLKWGTAVFDDLRQGIEELEFLADPTAGQVSIGCPEPYAAGMVATIIDRLLPKFPKAAFRIVTADTVSLHTREFSTRNIELALMPIGELSAHDLDIEFLFNDRHVVVAAPSGRWACRRKLVLADLIHEPWVLPPAEFAVATYIAQAFQAAGVEVPHVHVATTSIPLHHTLVASGRFLTMLPVSMLHYRSHPPLKRLPVDILTAPRPIGIVTVKNRTISPLAHLFIECAREVAKSPPKG